MRHTTSEFPSHLHVASAERALSPQTAALDVSLEALYHAYGRRLLRTLRSLCDDNLEDAKDLSQRVWFIVARRLQEITLEQPWHFIEKVMLDEVKGGLRTTLRRRGKLDLLLPLLEPVQPPEVQEPSPELWGCLERLSRLDQRIVLDFYGLRIPPCRSDFPSALRSTPPFLRVVSRRGTTLEQDEALEPPTPISDEQQAKHLSDELHEPWSARRVKVRRCRALSALADCLKGRAETQAPLGPSQHTQPHESTDMTGLEGSSRSVGAVQVPKNEEDAPASMLAHPSVLVLSLTADDPQHPAQQHLRVCSPCQQAAASLQQVEMQLLGLAERQHLEWRRQQEEQVALEEVWHTLQAGSSQLHEQISLSMFATEQGALPTASPTPEPSVETVEPPPHSLTEPEARAVPISSVDNLADMLPERSVESRFHRWRLISSVALAAVVLLVVGLSQQDNDPLGLGSARYTRGGGTLLEVQPHHLMLERWSLDQHGWEPIRVLREVDASVSYWRGVIPADESLRLTLMPPLSPIQQGWMRLGLGSRWSGSLDCALSTQETLAIEPPASTSHHQLTWKHIRVRPDSQVQIPLPTAPPPSVSLECWIQQQLGSEKVQPMRFVLTTEK